MESLENRHFESDNGHEDIAVIDGKKTEQAELEIGSGNGNDVNESEVVADAPEGVNMKEGESGQEVDPFNEVLSAGAEIRRALQEETTNEAGKMQKKKETKEEQKKRFNLTKKIRNDVKHGASSGAIVEKYKAELEKRGITLDKTRLKNFEASVDSYKQAYENFERESLDTSSDSVEEKVAKKHEASRWEKAKVVTRSLFMTKEGRQVLGKAGYDLVTSVAGVKTVTDLVLATRKKGDIYNYFKQRGEVNQERQEIGEVLDNMSQVVKERREKRKENIEVPEDLNESVAEAASAFKKKVDQAKYLSEDDRREFKQQLTSSMSLRQEKIDNLERQKTNKIKETMGTYLRTKIRGVKLVRDVFNTSLMLATLGSSSVAALGGMSVRSIGYAAAATIERGQEASVGHEKEQLKKESSSSEESEETKAGLVDKVKYISKDIAINATVETARALAFKGKKEGSEHKVVDFVGAATTVLRAVGIAGPAVGEVIDRISEQSDSETINQVLEVVSTESVSGAGEEFETEVVSPPDHVEVEPEADRKLSEVEREHEEAPDKHDTFQKKEMEGIIDFRETVGKKLIVEDLGGESPYNTVIPHESEIDALNAAREECNGSVAYLKGNHARNLKIDTDSGKFEVDPNHAFSEQGIERGFVKYYGQAKWDSLPEADKSKILNNCTAVTKEISDHIFQDNKPILTLHQNYAGGFGIEYYRDDPGFEQFREDIFVNPEKDPDSFAYVNTRQLFEALKKEGINVVLQKNDAQLDDGSISYAATKHGVAYVNFEVQHGKSGEQAKMIRTFNRLIEKDPSLLEFKEEQVSVASR